MTEIRDTTLFKIGDLAKRSGKSVRALHLYEEMGLLTPASRTVGGFRLFQEDVLERIHWIEMLQETGMSLHQIGDLLRSWWGQEHAPDAMERLRDVFASKLDEARANALKYERLAGELEASIRYLETCRSCHPAPAVTACSTCTKDHSTQIQPALVAGLSLHLTGRGGRAPDLVQIDGLQEEKSGS